MELELIPFEGIGPLKLGITREAFHKTIGGKVQTYQPAKLSERLRPTPLTDYFYDYDAKVEYDKHGRSMFIEVGGKMPVVMDGRNLFGYSYGTLLKVFKANDPELIIDDIGFTSKEFGVAVYAPQGVKDPRLACELVSVFVEGYYDKD